MINDNASDCSETPFSEITGIISLCPAKMCLLACLVPQFHWSLPSFGSHRGALPGAVEFVTHMQVS